MAAGDAKGDAAGGEGDEAAKPLKVAELMVEALRHVHDLVVDRLEQAEKEAAKRREKGRAKFRKLLETVQEMAISGTSFADWSRVREVLRDDAGFDAVETEAEREAMWSEYCSELKVSLGTWRCAGVGCGGVSWGGM